MCLCGGLVTKLCLTLLTLGKRSGFSRQEYWSGLAFPSPGDLPNPESPELQFFLKHNWNCAYIYEFLKLSLLLKKKSAPVLVKFLLIHYVEEKASSNVVDSIK